MAEKTLWLCPRHLESFRVGSDCTQCRAGIVDSGPVKRAPKELDPPVGTYCGDTDPEVYRSMLVECRGLREKLAAFSGLTPSETESAVQVASYRLSETGRMILDNKEWDEQAQQWEQQIAKLRSFSEDQAKQIRNLEEAVGAYRADKEIDGRIIGDLHRDLEKARRK